LGSFLVRIFQSWKIQGKTRNRGLDIKSHPPAGKISSLACPNQAREGEILPASFHTLSHFESESKEKERKTHRPEFPTSSSYSSLLSLLPFAGVE